MTEFEHASDRGPCAGAGGPAGLINNNIWSHRYSLSALTGSDYETKDKDALFARLRLGEPGPGYLHFPAERDAEFFRQLTSERVVTRFERGRPIRLWQPRRDGERNEALDTTVYAMATLHGVIGMGLQLNKEADALGASPRKGVPSGKPTGEIMRADPKVIRSRWMG
jgi:Phage terminase large subunit (GpA)